MLKTKKITKLSDLDKVDKLGGFFESIIISLPIWEADVVYPFKDTFTNQKAVKNIQTLVSKVEPSIKEGGALFIYGSPVQLTKIYENLSKDLKFRYWIALEILNSFKLNQTSNLKHNHIGVLMLTKGKGYLSLNTKETRTPYFACTSCGRNTKDWGGKKHLMNNKGGGISDVWRDMFQVLGHKTDPDNKNITIQEIDSSKLSFNFVNDKIPKPVLERLLSLVNEKEGNVLLVETASSFIDKINTFKKSENIKPLVFDASAITNKVILGDCISEMEKLAKKYPDGIFDLVFADPPYNLKKDYKVYDDTLADEEYMQWCDRWLELCVKLTKPTGSLLILNIPKWALRHAKKLNKLAYLQNWIVWDALSTPKGKIMPAHYALLYYTKNPVGFTYNHFDEVSAPEYCLRANCVNARERLKESIVEIKGKERMVKTSPISDIWWDLYRIKHKKNRDDHPCQLPDKLMDRIIKMFSREGDSVFDPFAGAGTTAIRAMKNKRNYTTIEIDPYYKAITEKKLEQVKNNGDVVRKTVNKNPKSMYTKKSLEVKVQEFSQQLGRKPELEEFLNKFSLDLSQIELLYGDPRRVLKAGRIGVLNKA